MKYYIFSSSFLWRIKLDSIFFSTVKHYFRQYSFREERQVGRTIIPLVLLRSRLSTWVLVNIIDSLCWPPYGPLMYRGFMRWCTSDGSASGWVWPSGRWVVPALDASWLQAFYDFWHTYENSHFKPYLTFDKSCVSRPNFWLLRRGPQARVRNLAVLVPKTSLKLEFHKKV